MNGAVGSTSSGEGNSQPMENARSEPNALVAVESASVRSRAAVRSTPEVMLVT